MSHDLSPDDPSHAGQNPEPVYEGAFSIEPVVGPLLWIYDLEDQEKWGNVIHLPDDELGLSPELSDELTRLGRWYDDSFDWADPSGPSPWRQDECDRFNQAVIDTSLTMKALRITEVISRITSHASASLAATIRR